MHRLTDDERPHYERWLDGLSGGDPRLRELLAMTLGRFAAGNLRHILDERGPGSTMKLGDLPQSKGLPSENAAIVRWLREALDRNADWLHDVDGNGIPKLLSSCETDEELLDAAAEDQGVHWLHLPR
jgi:hypothetical protein